MTGHPIIDAALARIAEADRKAEEIVPAELSKARPGYAFLMEERGAVAGDDEFAVDHAPIGQVLAQRVEESVRATGSAEVDAHEVGLAVLEPLRELDEVAYLRFASVYRNFESMADFEAEIVLLRADREISEQS